MESLGGQLASAPTAVSWGTNRVDVFAAGPANTPWHWWWDGRLWVGPAPLPPGANIPAVGIAVVSLGPGLLDVFAASGQGNTPWWWRWNGTIWSPPHPLPMGANLPAETVAATSSAPNCLDVFAAGAGNTPWWWHWDGTGWTIPQPLPGTANLPAERITAISPRPNRLDVFAAGNGNNLWHWWREGGPNWIVEAIGGNLPPEGVSVVSSGPNRMDVFAASRGGAGNPLEHWSWDGTSFSPPEDVPGNLTAATVSAVSTGANQWDIFGIAGDGQLVRWRFDGSSWIGPNPRGLNLPAGDVSAVTSAPGRVDVFARGADGTLQHWPGAGLSSCTGEGWMNFGGNQSVPAPVGHCHPGSLDELVGIVHEAEKRGRKVRAVGSSWSFSDVAVTPDYIVETNLLNSVLTGVLHASPSALNGVGSGLKLLHVEAGIALVDLNKLLDARGLALKTMGGASGQTLAGAVSTCVHGADIDRGPLPDAVRAIHLIGPGGVQHWIEPAAGITDPARVSAVLGIDPANVHHDDDWFNSVLVSVGSLGIIYSLIIEVVAQYDLVEDCQHFSWEAMRPLLATGDPFSGKRCVQVAINPFKVPDLTGTPTHQCYLVTRTEGPATQPDPSGGDSIAQIWHWLGGAATALMNIDPNLIETVLTSAMNGALPVRHKMGIAHSIMATADPPPDRGLGLEIAFDGTNSSYLSFVDEALQILETAYQRDHMGLGGWFSLRFVGPSRAYLSPQHKWTRTVMAEFVGLSALHSTRYLLDLLEAAGKRHGGVQHWGMFNAMTETDVGMGFPDLQKWLWIRSLLTNGGVLHTFDNAFAERCGLTRQPTARGLRNRFDDFDGDGKGDLAVWRPSSGQWWLAKSSSPQSAQQWGVVGDIPVPGDYDGDGKADLAIWRPNTGEWWAIHSANGAQTRQQWGAVGDVPAPGDYDGDGKTDIAVWRTGTGVWWVVHSSDGAQTNQQWGEPGDIPVPADYDGDGKTDIAIWRPSTGEWWVVQSSDGAQTSSQWGMAGDIPVPGDYDGDGTADFAIWRPSTGEWWVVRSSDRAQVSQQWGQPGDIPVPADYDGDHKTDFAVWRPSTGQWWVLRSSGGAPTAQQWGQMGDIPLPAR